MGSRLGNAASVPSGRRFAFEFTDYESRDQVVGEIENVEVVDQYDEQVRISGMSGDVTSKAVTIRMTASVPGVDGPQTVTQTGHAVAVDGEWRWVLTAQDYEAYKADRCLPG